ncbi:MAG TPA: Mov34/MPN/PAD-1 family protein [Caulobacteraceae bacterium]|nr:Mov34/MPN/PAD-1 family protein [Caulobacteraceae bacterium]
MDDEDDLFRPPPPCPYQPSAVQLHVPMTALTATLTLLQRAGRRESGVFWYGARHPDGGGQVAYVVAPRQRMSWGNYGVSATALAEVVHRLPDGWKPLAQVHSHPGGRVEHSNYDDRMASSRKALSLVFPFYGRLNSVFPVGVGVHEWQNDYWHLLPPDTAAKRVVLTDGEVRVEDFR